MKPSDASALPGQRGYYSLIQFCPDVSRAEAANIGVLVFCPSQRFIAAKTTSDLSRIRQFFPELPVDPKRLLATLSSVPERIQVEKERFQTLDDLNRYIGTRANDVLLTAPRSMAVSDPAADLEVLFSDLVLFAPSRRRRKTRASLPELDHALRAERFRGRVDLKPKPVVVPRVSTKLYANYAYRNGRTHLIKIEDLPLSEKKSFQHASVLASQGSLLLDADHQLLVVSTAPEPTSTDENELATALRLTFERNSVAFFPSSLLQDLVARVDREAHP